MGVKMIDINYKITTFPYTSLGGSSLSCKRRLNTNLHVVHAIRDKLYDMEKKNSFKLNGLFTKEGVDSILITLRYNFGKNSLSDLKEFLKSTPIIFKYEIKEISRLIRTPDYEEREGAYIQSSLLADIISYKNNLFTLRLSLVYRDDKFIVNNNY